MNNYTHRFQRDGNATEPGSGDPLRTWALDWWNNDLSVRQKEKYFAEYKPFTPATNYNQFTGREIQNIWAVKKNEVSQEGEGIRKEAIDFAIFCSEKFRRSNPVGIDEKVWFPTGYQEKYQKRHHTTDELYHIFKGEQSLSPHPSTTAKEEETFTCKACQHKLPVSFCMRTEGYCYMCDPNVTLKELLEPTANVNADHLPPGTATTTNLLSTYPEKKEEQGIDKEEEPTYEEKLFSNAVVPGLYPQQIKCVCTGTLTMIQCKINCDQTKCREFWKNHPSMKAESNTPTEGKEDDNTCNCHQCEMQRSVFPGVNIIHIQEGKEELKPGKFNDWKNSELAKSYEEMKVKWERLDFLEEKVKEQELIIYGMEEGVGEWKSKCADLEWLLERAYAVGYLNQELPSNQRVIDLIASGEMRERWAKVKTFLYELISQKAPSEPSYIPVVDYDKEASVNFKILGETFEAIVNEEKQSVAWYHAYDNFNATLEKLKTARQMSDPNSKVLNEAVELLRTLVDFQNGPPLPGYEKGWKKCMEDVYSFLKEHEPK